MIAPKRNENPVHYWISLWPIAPLFGVPWRFEEMAPGAAFLRPFNFADKMAGAGAQAGVAVREAAEKVAEAAAEVIETPLASPEPKPEETAAGSVEAEPVVDVEDEPVAMAEPEPEPVQIMPPPILFSSAPETVDDLKQIKGVGPKLETMLNDMGIYRFEQIAAMSPANLAWVDENLTAFKGRPLRDDWVAQAKELL